MIKKIFILLVTIVFFLINNTGVIAATKKISEECTQGVDSCDPADLYSCQYNKTVDLYLCMKIAVGAGLECVQGVNTCPDDYSCQKAGNAYLCKKIAPSAPGGIGSIFGKISPPQAIQDFGGQDATGARGISTFLSNLISLIYVFAAIALLFMLLWGAFDWIISEGDKEKINSARNKIINAIIGLILFAVAFAFLRVLSSFTGFEFFKGSLDFICPPSGGLPSICGPSS